MPLAPGSRLGPYQIVASIGAGAMGEVYRARDTRLGREVAVKVLHAALASDDGAMARFEREARAVAALSHPNIIALFDVGREGGTAYVVTELLDGTTLRDRMRQGQIPVRRAVDYARQIALALAASHDRGIVHRDLKPENIFVTADGRIKVLDFGIAHIARPTALDSSADGATGTADTTPGSVFGTIGYMAPEQARGQKVDPRTDIFALGAVLYEMLSGVRAFKGETPADTLAAVLKAEIAPLPAALAHASAGLERVVQRCLESSPEARFQSARDLAFALDLVPLDVPHAAGAQPAGVTRRPWAIVALPILIALGLAGYAVAQLRPAPAAPLLPVRFGIAASVTWSDAASVSPDGQYIVYTGVGLAQAASPGGAAGGDRPTGLAAASGRFWLRRLDTPHPQRLSDTEAAVPSFFWSPDSRFLGYRAGNAILIRELPDGAPRVLAELPSAPQSVSWGADGTLLIAMSGGIYRMPSTGGTPELVLRTEPNRELWRGSPAFLSDGKRFLFTVLTSGAGEQALETRVASLDGKELATILKGVVGATYADGHLLFGAGGALFTQRFDAARLAVDGDRVQLADSVAQDWRTGRLAVGASHTGVLVFRSAPRDDAQFRIVDRFGRSVRAIGAPDSFTNFTMSPDESRIISARRDPLTGQISLWLIDVARGVTSLMTPANDTEDVEDPTWAPDSQHVAYRHGSRLVMRLFNGGPERTLVNAEAYPDAFSHDGRFLLYGRPNGNTYEQWAVDISTPGAAPVPVVTGVTLADEARFSPNRQWIAYHSNETRTAQIYVVPFPATGQKWQISQAGGVQPRWSKDGSELFFLDPDGRLMSAKLPASDPRNAGAPAALFASGLVPSDALDQFLPLRDGFLIRAPLNVASEAAAVQVLVNWHRR